ncbi:MAG TPA: hypothetical protein VJO99_11405 [Burkholderiaceae bacterium]|nr:hypothetical protein [Burkholderiaceae bacterium]
MPTAPKKKRATSTAAPPASVISDGPSAIGSGPPPVIVVPTALTSLFDHAKPGTPVVRPSDLLALRLELVNMSVKPGTPPLLTRGIKGQPAFIVLHFPPQAIAEQVYFQAAVPGTKAPRVPNGAPAPSAPNLSEKPDAPPIRARTANESRLVFKVDDPGFSVPWRLADVLAACEKLALSVPANALPRSSGRLGVGAGGFSRADIAKLPSSQRAALSSFALRSLAITAQEGPASTVLLARISQGGNKLGLALAPDRVPVFKIKPRPALPGATQTSIEMPWRLVLSPHAGERWHHAHDPVISPVTNRTELWHSRLVAPDAKGQVIEPPRPDPLRSTRAVWALTGEGSTQPMQSKFPVTADLPSTAGAPSPFRATLHDFDRFQIAHLSSNFSVSNYTPLPMDTNLMLLSSLGGWLDARGAWEPPGLSVEEWVHRATMGRDHYVRVVYKGYLFPFGHRVALIKVSERKFHSGRAGTESLPGNPAYLRQRMFILVRERERTFVDPQLVATDGRSFQRQFPFNSVRLLTEVTPDIDPPESAASAIGGFGQTLFWPCVGGQAFAFRCVGTDIDGRRSQFELPMIFMDNTLASPRSLVKGKLVADNAAFTAASVNAGVAQNEWLTNGARADRRIALFKRQRIALAPSLKSGDTSAEIEQLEFGAEIQAASNGLRTYSQSLTRPMFYPSVISKKVRIAALTQLSGSEKSNTLTWNATYLKTGFDAANKGQVFADVKPESTMAQLDFSTQGDRSGGFVQPNLKPSALSRLTGPVAGDATQFLQGKLDPAGVFPSSLSDLPLPLLFGCIPLGEVIQAVADLSGSPQKVPKFASEAATQVESFVNGLVRAYDFVRDIGSHCGSLAQAAIDVLQGILQDLLDQAVSQVQAQAAPVIAAVNDLKTALSNLRNQFNALVPAAPDGDLPSIDGLPSLASLPALIDTVLPQVAAIATAVNGATLPSGFKQSALGLVSKAQSILGDFKTLSALIPEGKSLFASLDAIVGHPEALGDLFSHPDQLAAKLTDVQSAIGPIKTTLAGFRLLDGAPKQTLLEILDVLMTVLGSAADLLKLLEMLTGEELVVRFDWSPEIKSWGIKKEADGSVKRENQLFRANDLHGFIIAVEARVKKSGGAAPKVTVVCSLKHFDLVLIAPASFIELNFEKIEFTVDSAAKMNVDVLLSDIKFVGPLSFVETLKDLIPLDGFSDPPHLDITPQGIDAGFSLSLPNLAVGMFSLTNLSLGAGFTVPFIGQPLSVRFNFCSREQPFNLTVTLFGGGGFFGITLDPHGIQILEASFEFGASIAVDFGVASGGVHVMAGIYFRMEQSACSLTGYFRLGGEVSVLCIISASLELYLELKYEFDTGKCSGKAELTIEVSIFMFSISVTVTCERKFAGSNGDPSFREIMGSQPALSLPDELNTIDDLTTYAWREYVEAFA